MAHDVAVASDECHTDGAEHTDALACGFQNLLQDLEGVPLNHERESTDDEAERGVPDVLAAGGGQRLDPTEFEAGDPAHDRHFDKQEHAGESPEHELARPGGVLTGPE